MSWDTTRNTVFSFFSLDFFRFFFCLFFYSEGGLQEQMALVANLASVRYYCSQQSSSYIIKALLLVYSIALSVLVLISSSSQCEAVPRNLNQEETIVAFRTLCSTSIYSLRRGVLQTIQQRTIPYSSYQLATVVYSIVQYRTQIPVDYSISHSVVPVHIRVWTQHSQHFFFTVDIFCAPETSSWSSPRK